MKNRLFALCMKAMIVVAVVAFASCASHRPGWKLVWKEDFSGKSIDESSWSPSSYKPSPLFYHPSPKTCFQIVTFLCP